MSLFVPPAVRATDANNLALPGAKWYFYATGGTTPAPTYTTSALNIAHTNPVVADTAGLFAPIFLDPTITYRAVLKTAAGVAVPNGDFDPVNGESANDLRFLQSGSGAVSRTAQNKLREPPATPNDFGAVGDGVTDDTTALNAWIANINTTREGHIPHGKFVFTAPLDPIIGSDLTVSGDGDGACLFYNGSATPASPLLTFGDATSRTQLTIGRFTIGSNVLLTAQKAVLVKNYTVVRMDINQNGPAEAQGNLNDGTYFDTCSFVFLGRTNSSVRGIDFSWRDGVELHCENATVLGTSAVASVTGTGFLCGGGCGGFYQEDLMLLTKDWGVKINNSLSAAGNTQFFFDSGSLDTCKSGCMEINDNTVNAVSKIISLGGWFSNTYDGSGIVIVNWNGGTVRIPGTSQIMSHADNGVYSTDPSIRMIVAHGAKINNNGAYGIDASGALAIECFATPYSNTSGSFGANITPKSTVLGWLGYGTGTGGAVTQITSRTTGVTLNKTCGTITLVSAAGTATWQTFTVTNSIIAVTDVIRVVQKSGTDKNMIHVTAVAAGSFDITFATTGGTTTEQPIFNFAVLKAVNA